MLPSPIHIPTGNIAAPFRAALGVLCFVGTLMATTQHSQALEYAGRPTYIPASLTEPVSAKATQTGLFGRGEQRYSDLSPFTKWNTVLDRFKDELMSSLDQKPVQDWLLFLDGLKTKSKSEQIEAVNHYMNQIKFVTDINNYGSNDYWATPMEFFAKGGDCEDYAMAKYISLRALGFSKDELRLVVVQDNVMHAPHAMIVAYNDGKAKILDNQNPAVLDSADITRYVPVYSISQLAWWRH